VDGGKGELTVAHYLIQFSYTSPAIRALVERPEVDHAGEAAALVASLGGELHGYWYAFGEFDGVVLIEAPDSSVPAAVAIAIGGTGEVRRLATTGLLDMDEARKAIERAAGAKHLPPRQEGSR